MIFLKKNLPDIIAVLPAAGIGRRMKCRVPKQYSMIGNKTLLEYSISTLMCQSCIKQIIVVISSSDHWFRKLSISNDAKVATVIGGKTRTDSVMAALKYMDKVDWVIVHDAVRPCLHQDDLLRLLEITVYSCVGGILAIPVADTIKKACVNSSRLIDYTVNRKNLWRALTPQLFNFSLLKCSLSSVLEKGYIISDESSALELFGYHPQLIIGRSDNIKVTYPEDLILASIYLSQIRENEEFLKCV
ncbi:2-C-methyl-D-erythritol 4-phosphate cytidylyltransferase [Blochmannia endosymbiont of Colobopsis nipponica]|uniref:2-C-methyl-D-erythritol 4-phosphate cytidylyltransferase n=1 Tax=Blochmannia endosymbiont of Colobopsis nipponica TaxID=2681987 RepID=UPI00177F98B3|nr:2-C-methyl-D-erythritol 4-phosphate cytidylyltransferase [Blochmannia endosymbiont of Colobopsis nipponica]QOI11241.1 2-C-methyl-D-erythritol 4-phosphate cytidylyltransferase [Blochmannia endosymbiont of Colobopsis nipponica]